MVNYLEKEYPLSIDRFEEMNTLKYRTLINLINKIDEKTGKGATKEVYRKYIVDGNELFKEIKEKNQDSSSLINPLIDPIIQSDSVGFNDLIQFFKNDYRVSHQLHVLHVFIEYFRNTTKNYS